MPSFSNPGCNRLFLLSPGFGTAASLIDLDAGFLDHLAPALLLATEIAVEFVRGARHHHQPLVDAELIEDLGFDRRGRRLVEAVDDVARRPGGGEQAIP